MPAPYSNDIRQKAVEAVDRGEKKSVVAKIFNLSRNSLDLWLKQRKETGSVKAKTDYHRGPSPKINDLEKFQQFAKENGHLTQEQMAQKWSESIHRTTIGKALKAINFTRKKKPTVREKETKKKEKNSEKNCV